MSHQWGGSAVQQRLEAFAGVYDAEADQLAFARDGQSSIRHPLVFLFVGDECQDALTAVYELNETKWRNGRGVVYAHIHTGPERTMERERVFGVRLPAPEADRKTIRRELRRQFYDETERLAELGRVFRQMANRLASFGDAYSSFREVNVAVVTMAHDPCGALLPELTLLLKAVLGEAFKQIRLDLYGLLCERRQDGDFAYAAASAVAFMREVDRAQSRDYRFGAPLLVTPDGIRLPVEHAGRPLFDLVYWLGDKNERGMFVERSLETNCEMISRLCLLKNRSAAGEYDDRQEAYNDQHFRQHLASAGQSGNVYATAGYSKVKRPNRAIALTVLNELTRHVVGRLKEQSAADRRTVMELWQLDAAAIDRRTEALVPARDELAEMNALLFSAVSADELKRMTLAEAEQWLYGGHAGEFFRDRFAARAGRALARLDVEREVREAAERDIMNAPRYGLYCAYAWTSESGDALVFQELRNWIRETARQLEEGRTELDSLLSETVDMQSFRRVPLMKKSTLKHFARYFFEHVYGKRLELLFLETKLELLRRYEAAFAALHERLGRQVERLLELEKRIREASRQSVSEANDSFGRNIAEYYAVVVADVFKELEAKRGDGFLFDERCVGPVAAMLESGPEPLLERLIDVCRKDIFPREPFRQSFEDELIRRANVTVRFDDRDRVLSKEELYRDLYDTLKEQAAVHIEVYNYTHKHRHEEHYFFGDAESEFIRYAFAADRGNRAYKLGCVHEPKNSGIEKLTLMGGFRLEDLLAYRNGGKYYDSYLANGFQFHDGPSEES